jgi:hypothetical protein
MPTEPVSPPTTAPTLLEPSTLPPLLEMETIDPYMSLDGSIEFIKEGIYGQTRESGVQYYNYGEPIKIDVSFTNDIGKWFDFFPFPPALTIVRDNRRAVIAKDDDIVRILPAGTDSVHLGDTDAVNEYVWDQLDASGAQVSYGRYYLRIEDPWKGQERYQRTPNSNPVSLWGGLWAFSIYILPRGGSMENQITVGQSVQIGDFQIILDYVVMTPTTTKVYCSFVPRGIIPDESPIAAASYSVDGEPIRTAPIGFLARPSKTKAGDFWFMWNIDPVPSYAKEMTFSITYLSTYLHNQKISEWKGQLDFKIPLQ